MAIIKSFAPFLNLSNFQVFLDDEKQNSEYFKITELKETFTGGKNGFLIEGSPYLKETTEVKIEILDVEGNPIYFEPGKGTPDYYEGNSTLISIHVYDDTPIGIGKITILGELKSYLDENNNSSDIPDEWAGVYNVKWEREISVNKNVANETTVRFYKRPIVTISEIVKPVFSKTINDTTDTGNVNGFPLQPPLGQKLSEWSAGTNYLLQRTAGSWDVDVDENIISIASLNYSPTIIEVLNDTELIVDIPHTDANGNVASFSSEAFSVSYQDIENETIGETSITGSFAKIDIKQLKTFVGDVARVKIFRKSRNAVGDFSFVQEAKLESQELLRDVTTTTDTEVFYGKLTNDTISNYWVSSSNDHPISVDSSILSRAVHIDYNNDSGSVQQFITSRSIEVSNDVEYTLNFKTLLSGSIDDTNKSVRAFFSSSDFTQDFLTVSGSAIYQSKQDISQNIISTNTGSANLVFEVQGDDWYISNISLRNAQDTSFSPDEFTIIQDIPRKTATETFDFKFEFYDVNNNFIPVDVLATKEFDGGNDFPTSGKLFTFESDRNAFRFSSGSIGNPPFQQIQFKTSQQNLTGSVTFASSAFDEDGNYIDPSSYGGDYPGGLTSITPAGSIITIANFSGSEDDVVVGSIIYTASLGSLEEFETVYRLEDGDNAPQLIVTSNANQFIYEPTTLSPKPSGQSITVRAQRKNLASLVTPIEVNSGSNKPGLTFVDTVNGIDTYTISATEFSESFSANSFDEVTYEFTGSDVFGNEQSDEITLSKVVNFDAVSLVLSNESTSFPAKSTGETLGNLVPSSGSVQMFIGSNQITHDDELGGRTKNTFNITSSIGDNVTPTDTTPNTSNYSISAFETSKDSGSLTLTIDYLAGDSSTTQSFEKVVSYTKSKKAVPTVLTKISPSTQTINSSSLGYDSPQTMEVIVQEGGDEYTFDSSNLSGGGDALAQKFNINSLFVDSGSISNSDNILTFGSLTSSFNSIIGSASLDYVDSEGTYVTGKKVRFDLAVSKIGVDGINGASGSNARAVSLSSTKYAVVYDGDGVLFPTSQPFTLSGSQQNFSNPQFQFLQNGSDISDGFGSVSELIIPTDTGSLPTAGGTNLYEVRVRETGGSWDDFNVLDNIDIFGVQSGSDAFTVFLTNEAHVFSATSESVITSDLEDGAFETRFFRGADQYNLGTTGKTYSISATSSSIELTQSTNSNQKLFTPTSISADSGSATITVTDNNTGQTFDKQYSFTLSKEGLVGERGADGANGASGSNAKVVSLSSTKYAVVYDGDGVLFPTDQNFNLSGSSQNFTNPEFQFLSASAVLHDFASTSEVTISSSGYPEAGNATLYEVRVRENGGSYEGVFDNIDVFGVQSGSDSFTTFLTNEAHVFSANSDGVVTSTLADGSFETRFFRGAEQYNFGTSGKTYSVSATSSSIELTQSTNSNQRKFTPTAASADNGSASITLTDNNTGQSFEKTYTFSKSKKGAPVTTIAASPQSQTITSGSGGIGTPTDVTITVNEGGSDYTHTTGTVSENEFKITGVTNATNNNDGTISPDTPTNSTPVVGDATISYTNSEGTAFTSKTIPFDVGVAGLGDTGAVGSAGSDSLSVKLTATQYVVLYDGDGTKTAVDITLTGTPQNFTSPEYRFLQDSVEKQAWSTTTTYTILDADEAAANSTDLWRVEVREGSSGTYDAFDEVNIYGVKEGTTGGDGGPGDPGDPGADAYTVILTNEAHTLPTTNAGTVTYTGSGTSIIVYKGSTELNSVTSTPSTNQFKVTVTSDTDIDVGTQTVSGNPSVFGVASNCTADTANIEFSINIENEVSITKIQSFSKSIEGADGSPGAAGKRTASNMVHYQLSGSIPSTPSATSYTFATNAFSGLTSNWGTGAPTYDAGNSNEYWYSTYTVVETTAGGGTGSPSFSTPVQAIGFSGLVTFTAGNSESIDNGDGDLLSFGTAGTTKIHGDNIATGKIISTNYATGSGDGFTESGSLFDLDNSTLAAPKFSVNSDGVVKATEFVLTDGSLATSGSDTSTTTIGGDGSFSANNANISGSITANDGTIGGFVIDETTLTSIGEPFLKLSAGNIPSLVLFESEGTASVKITADETLTSIDVGTSAPELNVNSYSGVTGGGTDTSFSNFGSSLSLSQSSTQVTSLSSNVVFPSTGTIHSDFNGETATFTGTLTPQSSPTYFVEADGECLSGNIAFMSVSAVVFIEAYNSSNVLQASSQRTVSNSIAGFGSNLTLDDGYASGISFSLEFDITTGQDYYFKVGIQSANGYIMGTAPGVSLDLSYEQPTIGNIQVSIRGGTDTVPFSELTRGGFQVVGSAAAGTDKRAVKIPADTGVDTFQVTGSISATGDITAFSTSDERLKENIVCIENPLDKVKQLRGIEFTWKPGFENIHLHGTGSDIGVIAQEVQAIMPRIVKQNIFNNYLGVQYEKLTPLLLEAVKELSNKVTELENKLKDKE